MMMAMYFFKRLDGQRFNNYVIYHNPINEYTNYMLTEIWIRPTIIYGLVVCFISEKEDNANWK